MLTCIISLLVLSALGTIHLFGFYHLMANLFVEKFVNFFLFIRVIR